MNVLKLSVVGCLLLSGCAAIQSPFKSTHKVGELANGPTLDELRKSTSYKDRAGLLSEDETRDLAHMLIGLSDKACEDYLVGLSVQRNSTASLLDVSSLALSTGAALATPTASANLLGGLAGFFTGTRQSLTTNVFGGREFALLYSAVKKGRHDDRETFTDALDAKKWGRMSVDGVSARLAVYHTSCGINYGLQMLNEAIGE